MGWTLSHRVVLQAGRPVIAETRVAPTGSDEIPYGGLSSALLRLVNVGKVVDAAPEHLPKDRASSDPGLLQMLGRKALSSREERLWTLVVTADEYMKAVARSRKPNRVVADRLGIKVATVTDRIHAARSADPPLLTGGGKRGKVGKPELTAAAHDLIAEHLERVIAEAAYPPRPEEAVRSLAMLYAAVKTLAQEVGRRYPRVLNLLLSVRDQPGQPEPGSSEAKETVTTPEIATQSPSSRARRRSRSR